MKTRKPWEKQEKRYADLLGGTRSPGSGSGWVRKNDVRSRKYLVEAKWTGKKTYTIRADVLQQLAHNAAVDDRVPVFALEIGGKDYLVIRKEDFPFEEDDNPHQNR